MNPQTGLYRENELDGSATRDARAPAFREYHSVGIRVVCEIRSRSAPSPAVANGTNLLLDPSFENTALTLLPRDWRAWLNDGQEFRCEVVTFDQNLGAFRQWLFSSNGKSFESRGQWDEATQTLELRMLPDASNMFASEHFVNADRIEVKMRQQFVMGSRDVGRWTTTRKAATAKVDVPTVKAHAAEPAELALLDKLAGEWAIHGKSKPSVWRPEAAEERFTEQIAWILGGKFLMARAFNEKGELTSIWIATYEPLEKSNHAWFFNADGSSGQWRVTWDATSRSFQWHSIDMPTGWTGTALNRLIDDDTFDNQALIKDENGRVMLDMTQDKRRKK